MASNNVLKIAFLADASGAVSAFGKVGNAAEAMGSTVEKQTEHIKELSERLENTNTIFSGAVGAIGDISGAVTAFAEPNQIAAQSSLNLAKAQQAVQDALAQSGASSNEYKQALIDLQAAQAAASPLGEFAQDFEKYVPVFQGILGTFQLINDVVGVTKTVQLAAAASAAAESAALAANSAAKIENAAATQAMVIAEGEVAVATDIATASVTALDIALAASGIGLILAAVGAIGFGAYKLLSSDSRSGTTASLKATASSYGGTVVNQTNHITAPLGSDRAAIGQEINKYAVAYQKSSGLV
jgi:hypothetical protein